MRRRQGCRFVSFLAAALTLVAWTSFLATDSFGVANYAISHVVGFNPNTSMPYEHQMSRLVRLPGLCRCSSWHLQLR